MNLTLPGTFLRSSLQQQLTAVLCTALLAVFLASVLGVSYLVKQTEQQGWHGRQTEAARRAAEAIRAFLTREQRVLMLIDLFGRDEMAAVHSAEMEQLLERNPEFLEILYLKADGRVLQHMPKKNPVLANLFTIPQSNWFLKARQGQVYFGDIQLSFADQPYLILAMPASGGSVIAARLRMKVLQDVLADLRFGKSGISYLANSNGRIIAHTDAKIMLTNATIDDQSKLFKIVRSARDSWAGEYTDLTGRPVVGTTVAVKGTPWVIVSEVTQDEAYSASRNAWWMLLAGALLVGLVLSLFVSYLLRRQFLQPMQRLSSGVSHISRGDLHYRIGMDEQSEIGQVATAFDNMTARLEARERQVAEQTNALMEAKDTLEERVQERTRELRDQFSAKEKALTELAEAQNTLLAMSRAAGMAEVATGVLHNVGNVLNSVNVSCTLIMDQLNQSRVGNISRMAELIAEPEGDLVHFFTEDPRGRQIPAYLVSLAPVLEEERQLLLRETLSLRNRIEHIKEIVAMQQNYGRVSGIKETVLPERLLEDAVTFNAEALKRDNIAVDRRYEPAPPINVDKHKVLQILLNLISNARHACIEGGTNRHKCITLRVFIPTPDCLRIQVEDNGMGIIPENLARIFQHGFTTRKSGHGFGLHSGALAALELGGCLTAHSDGQGAGAIFTLDLPYQKGG